MSGIHFDGHFTSYKELVELTIPATSHFRQALEFCKNYWQQEHEYSVNTSGSTGTPKSITLKRDQLKSSAWMTIRSLNLRPEDKGLVCISTDHIGGKMMLVRGMELGMDLYLVEPSSDIRIKNLPVIDFVALVPLQLQTLIRTQAGTNFLNTCRVIIVGGGQVNESLENKLENISTPIFQTFGMTETVSHFALKRLNGPLKDQNYHAFEQLKISLNENGCMVVEGEMTNNLPIVTNDLVELVGQREFRWLGRYDNAINTGGYKVIPEQLYKTVSKCLRSAGINCEFVIIGLPHTKWGQQVTLVLENIKWGQELNERLIRCLKVALHPYQVPKLIEHLKQFPRTETGKIDNSKIVDRLSSRI